MKKTKCCMLKVLPSILPALVAQLDVCVTGELKVASSTPAEATFFHGDHEIFSIVNLSLPLI